VIATNLPFDKDIAEALGDIFVECIASPGYSPQALEVLAKRKNLRLVVMPDTSVEPSIAFCKPGRAAPIGGFWRSS
jgi:phosphoribosylaminoimidazolecarboxamide formyltransferase/IMP cyclohydrolase